MDKKPIHRPFGNRFGRPGMAKPRIGELNEAGEFVERLRQPQGKEILGIVEQRHGGSRMSVRCFDGVRRIARIPGRLKKKLWVRENDIVLIEPWEYSTDKCDIVFKYSKNQVEQLKKKGLLDSLSDVEEF